MMQILAGALAGFSLSVAVSSIVRAMRAREKSGVRVRVGTHTLDFTPNTTEEEFEDLLARTLSNGKTTAATR